MGPPVPSPFGKREKGVSVNVLLLLLLSWGAILIAFFSDDVDGGNRGECGGGVK